MEGVLEITLSREQLYELVWATPPQVLTKVFGVSDASLTKTCRRFNIPKPTAGTWKRIQEGEKVQIDPLPVWTKKTSSFVTIKRTVVESLSATVQKLIDEELSPENRIVLSHNEPQQLVERTRIALSKATPNDYHRVCAKEPGCLAVEVSSDRIPRALKVWNTLLEVFSERGWTVSVKDELSQYSDFVGSKTYVLVREEMLEVKIDEPSVRRHLTPEESDGLWSKPYDERMAILNRTISHKPGGLIRFNVVSYPFHRHWTEKPQLRMENNLNHITAMLIETSEKARVKRLEMEARKAVIDKELEIKYEIWERERREKARRKGLEESITAWGRYSAGISFLNTVEHNAKKVRGNSKAELNVWLKWARALVEERNPMTDILNNKFPESTN